MKTTPTTRSAEPADVAFGARIRERRRALGISQSELALRSKVTFQQVQKYELGANRVSISRALQIAQALDCRLSDLLQDLEADPSPGATAVADGSIRLLSEDGARALLSSFARIESPQVRRRVLSLVKAMTQEAGPPAPE